MTRRAPLFAPILAVVCAILFGLWPQVAPQAQTSDPYAPPANYYSGTTGLTGNALRLKLNDIIDGQTVVPYTSTDEAFRVIDENATDSSRIDLLYGPFTALKTATTYNREHTWPVSRGIDTSGPDYSDLHHLRPSDIDVNSVRGNLPFDISSAVDGTVVAPAAPEAGPDTSRDPNSFQPPADERGDIARGLFYMDVRYDGADASTTDLQLVDSKNPTGSQMAVLSTLLKWHREDPVSTEERKRNQLIYANYQGNRNPFIDNPDFVEAIFGGTVPATPTPGPTSTPQATPQATATPSGLYQPLPFAQDWSNTNLITTDDDWSNVPGIIGYRGDGLTAGTDPRGVTTDSTVVDINANQTDPSTFSGGGVTEFQITNPTIALAGSGTADAPYIVLHLNTSGLNTIRVRYRLRDLDASIDNAIQPVALQWREGTAGAWQNVPAAYVADATSGPSLATLTTDVDVVLPPDAADRAQLQVRVITTNAVGNDEPVGIDDISVSGQAVTAVALISFQARHFTDGLWVSWRTGLETDNLGFWLYRQDRLTQSNGKMAWSRPYRLNPSLIAGAALQNGANAAPDGGFLYGWRDTRPLPHSGIVRYWLQDVEVGGQVKTHGPALPAPAQGSLSKLRRSPLVAELLAPRHAGN